MRDAGMFQMGSRVGGKGSDPGRAAHGQGPLTDGGKGSLHLGLPDKPMPWGSARKALEGLIYAQPLI